jgi:hypothetical protein
LHRCQNQATKKASTLGFVAPYLSRPISPWNKPSILATSGQFLQQTSWNFQPPKKNSATIQPYLPRLASHWNEGAAPPKKLNNDSSILATSGPSLERIHLTTSGEKIPQLIPQLARKPNSHPQQCRRQIESIRRSFQWKQPFNASRVEYQTIPPLRDFPVARHHSLTQKRISTKDERVARYDSSKRNVFIDRYCSIPSSR